jgi:hypothetical protein
MMKADPLRFCQRGQSPTAARHAAISQAAYVRAQRRGFEPGRESEDWLIAEAEIDRQMSR